MARRAAAPAGRAPARGQARRAGARRRRVRAAGAFLAGKPGALERRGDRLAVGAGQAAAPARCRARHCAATIEMGKQIVFLEDHRDRPGRRRQRVTSTSPISTRPDRGVSKPATRLSSVDLPEPLGPMIAVILARPNCDIEDERRLGIAERDIVQPHRCPVFHVAPSCRHARSPAQTGRRRPSSPGKAPRRASASPAASAVR